MNHYQLLGIAMDATAEEIKRAYRRAAAAVHPDRFANVSESKAETAERARRFGEMRTAYETLSDRRQRSNYDRSIQVPQGLGDMLATPHGQRAMDRLLPRASKQARDGNDLLVVARASASVMEAGGVLESLVGIPEGFDQLHVPSGASQASWGRFAGRGEPREHDGEPGDLFLLLIPGPG